MPPDTPRQIALSILNQVQRSDRILDEIVADHFERQKKLEKRDKALITQIVFGVIRWRGRLDWTLQQFSKMKLPKIDPYVLNILRMGLFQIQFLDRIPASAAVNTSVELAKRKDRCRQAGFVNGILRNIIRNIGSLEFPRGEERSVAALAIEVSFPEWMLKRWIKRLGWEQTRVMCRETNKIPPITIRANTLKTSRNELFDHMVGDVSTIAKTSLSPAGLLLTAPKQPIKDMLAFKRGWFQVQDEAAQLVSYLLDPQPDDTVLDACAGQGGKTGHIAQLMQNRGKIFALDKDQNKLDRLKDEMRRLGVYNVTAVSHHLDSEMALPSFLPRQFDRILLDAPCSGLGVIRRNPDIKWRLAKMNLERYHKRQVRLLAQMAPLVKPGGILVYAVCSHEPEESVAVIDTFLRTHPGFACNGTTSFSDGLFSGLYGAGGFVQTFPHLHQMDGFTIAKLKLKFDNEDVNI